MLWAFIAAALAASPDPDALRAACSDGQGEACRTLGGLYLVGVAVDADDTTGARFMEMACDAGDMKGCTQFGALSLSGVGTPYAPLRSEALFKKACDAGLGEPCHYLASQYLLGIGVDTDPELARAHLSLIHI